MHPGSPPVVLTLFCLVPALHAAEDVRPPSADTQIDALQQRLAGSELLRGRRKISRQWSH